jgi:hypothetical protein
MAGHDWIEIKSYSLGSHQFTGDSFIFVDSSQSSPGGFILAVGDVNDALPPHTPEWSNPRSGDPAQAPGSDDPAAVPAVQKGEWIMDVSPEDGAHALYQDLLLPY